MCVSAGDGGAINTTGTVTLEVTPLNDAPIGLPTINGKAKIGETLTTDITTFNDVDGIGESGVTFQWLLDGSPVGGEQSGTIQIREEMLGGTLNVIVSYLDAGGGVESVTSEATNAVRPAGYDITGTVRFWRDSQPLSGVMVTEGELSASTEGDGRFELFSVEDMDGVVDDGTLHLQPTKQATALEQSSITLTDVLAGLKLYLGKSIGNLQSDYNYIAADFNADGRVNLTDVLMLLKYYLGKETGGVIPQWFFVDTEGQDGEGLETVLLTDSGERVSVDNSMPHNIEHDFSLDSGVGLVGILRGDVDGSWEG